MFQRKSQDPYARLTEEMSMLPDELDTSTFGIESMRAKQKAEADALNAMSAQNMAQGGGVKKTGDLLTAGGAAGMNPYVAGAGLTLSAIGMVDDAKRRNEQAQIDAHNKKIMAQRQAIRNIFG